MFVDEAFFAGDPSVKGKLNGLITEPEILLEAKFKMPVRFPNRRSFILASNDARVVPAGLDARRYGVLKVNESRKRDRKYFAALTKELDDGGRLRCCAGSYRKTSATWTLPGAHDGGAHGAEKLNFTSVERYWLNCVLNAQLPKDLGQDQP